MEDVDLSLDDMIAKVNSTWWASSSTSPVAAPAFIGKRFDGKLGASDRDVTREYESAFAQATIAGAYEERDYSRALREIMRLADVANQFVNERKPWELAKQDGKDAELHAVCSTALTLFRDLALYLKPVLPALAANVEGFLAIAPLAWTNVWEPLPAGHTINPTSTS